ncbi:MAG: gamma-glutamyl-gamma-aminobutyrate hydrolase family protein [Ignavibacteriae bacterium]|nr:gamma-glutamyl-gamma-aminobutyrate hydrolase family protein [Ignavibacteriota bacterium]
MGAEEKFWLYINWLKSGNPDLEWVKLSYVDENLSEIEKCDGVLLTGGGDVEPSLYDSASTHPKVYGVDHNRDDFERQVIDETLRQEKPLLGICRGLQIANVHFGGTLIQDLEEIGHTEHSTKDEYEQRHWIELTRTGILSETIERLTGNVNSFHHQAADKIGSGLAVAARSVDGIVEAIEFEDALAKPFFLCVQWHPERMKDAENPFSKNILDRFLTSIRKSETAKAV